jgi:hypothetical protein
MVKSRVFVGFSCIPGEILLHQAQPRDRRLPALWLLHPEISQGVASVPGNSSKVGISLMDILDVDN